MNALTSTPIAYTNPYTRAVKSATAGRYAVSRAKSTASSTNAPVKLDASPRTIAILETRASKLRNK